MGEFQSLIPGLPEDLAIECLTRLPSLAHRVAASVCQAWRRLLGSPEYFHRRKQNGHTYRVACLIQALCGPGSEPKPTSPPTFGITLLDLKNRTYERVDSLSEYPNGLPLYCQVAGLEGKLVVMGGWDPVSYDPTSNVFIYDLMARKWKKGRDMPTRRSLFATGAINGRILVAGGHDSDKNALDSAWVYDMAEDKWMELGRMSEERDECRGIGVGPEFWVIGGYSTEAQGRFKSSADVYNIDTCRWTRVEDVWFSGQTPRSCIGFGPKGKLINCTRPDSPARTGKFILDLGDDVIVYDDDVIPEFFVVNKEKHANTNGDCMAVDKLDVPIEFLGFVTSGCSVEF